MKNLTLITGGVRCGKSALAESIAHGKALPVYYLATMPRIESDTEQCARIEKHRRRRPSEWKTIECSNGLSKAIVSLPAGPAVALIDCLSLEVTNIMLANGGEDDPYKTETLVSHTVSDVLSAIESRPDVSFLVVTNETGWGVVPESALGRAFRDFLGSANQEFAKRSDEVFLVCSGIKLQLKP